MGRSQDACRTEVLMNLNVVCDDRPWHTLDTRSYNSEVPAPKAGIRVGDMKLLIECYDWDNGETQGRHQLYNITADPGESKDLAADFPLQVTELSARIVAHGR